jgi:hypothetical protein
MREQRRRGRFITSSCICNDFYNNNQYIVHATHLQLVIARNSKGRIYSGFLFRSTMFSQILQYLNNRRCFLTDCAGAMNYFCNFSNIKNTQKLGILSQSRSIYCKCKQQIGTQIIPAVKCFCTLLIKILILISEKLPMHNIKR